MPKATTASFVLTLRLETENDILDKRFRIANHIHNILVKHARRCLSQLKQDKQYKSIIKNYSKNKTFQKGDKTLLSDLRQHYGLSEYQFHNYVKKQKHLFSNHIDINTAQKIATNVWQSVSNNLFKKGKFVHFNKLKDFSSVEGKTNTSGIRYNKQKVYWKGLVLPVRIKKKDAYAKECLNNNSIKYCRIVRKWHKHSHYYYVQLVMKGIPPLKHKFDSKDTRSVGIDAGTSTMAVVSDDNIIFTELAHKAVKIEKDIIRLNRKSNRQRHANNPLNYNQDGTIKRNSKTFHRNWIISRRHRLTIDRMKMLYRKRSEMLRYEHNKLANEILLTCGSDIYAEQMSYKSLQKRSSKTEISEKTGTFKKKKRFGKSLQNHAPSMFLNIINTKLSYIGKHICYVNTQKTRCSQFNHISGECQKATLSERWKQLSNEIIVQRDLYSAFLLQHAQDQETIDTNACIAAFDGFKILHNKVIQDLKQKKQEGTRYPSCMGI
ncbi:MAG: transposase [Longicatena sp.]